LKIYFDNKSTKKSAYPQKRRAAVGIAPSLRSVSPRRRNRRKSEKIADFYHRRVLFRIFM